MRPQPGRVCLLVSSVSMARRGHLLFALVAVVVVAIVSPLITATGHPLSADVEGQIVGGFDALPKQFPYMASLWVSESASSLSPRDAARRVCRAGTALQPARR